MREPNNIALTTQRSPIVSTFHKFKNLTVSEQRNSLGNMKRSPIFFLLSLTLTILLSALIFPARSQGQERSFHWISTDPVVLPVERKDDPCYSVKDPSIVQFQGKWYLFMTIRSVKRTHQIEFLSFSDWNKANSAKRTLLKMHPGYYCAPQVFYFTPHKKWYLICQASDPSWKDGKGNQYDAAYSTTDNIDDPDSWAPLKPMRIKVPTGSKKPNWSGLDFWVICDAKKAHLFFTRDNGEMWRVETDLKDFPLNWSEPKLALKDDIFEASHTYKIKEKNQYLTIIEAINRKARLKDQKRECGHRYYKAYLADSLDGIWTPLATEKNHPFAGIKNVQFKGSLWSESISHGELLRSGYDEKMEIDLNQLTFLYQGVLDKDIPKDYGKIPYKLGLLQEDKK